MKKIFYSEQKNPHYRFIMPNGIPKFARFARNVWNLEEKSEEELAKSGIDAMKAWMEEIGVAKTLTDLGATPDMIDGIADATFILSGGYRKLTRDDVISILKESL